MRGCWECKLWTENANVCKSHVTMCACARRDERIGSTFSRPLRYGARAKSDESSILLLSVKDYWAPSIVIFTSVVVSSHVFERCFLNHVSAVHRLHHSHICWSQRARPRCGFDLLRNMIDLFFSFIDGATELPLWAVLRERTTDTCCTPQLLV